MFFFLHLTILNIVCFSQNHILGQLKNEEKKHTSEQAVISILQKNTNKLVCVTKW